MRLPAPLRFALDAAATATASGLVFVAGFIACGSTSGPRGASDGCRPVQAIIEPTIGHVLPPATVQYEHHPPTSGRHVHDPPQPGIHTQPVPEANQVAALERGWVILQYGARASERDRARLRRFAGPDVVVAPANTIDGGRAIAFTAWEHRQLCDHASSEAARRFIDRFRGKAGN